MIRGAPGSGWASGHMEEEDGTSTLAGRPMQGPGNRNFCSVWKMLDSYRSTEEGVVNSAPDLGVGWGWEGI